MSVGQDPSAFELLPYLAAEVIDVVERSAQQSTPRSAVSQAELAELVAGLDPCPDDGAAFGDVLSEIGDKVLAHGVRPANPWCAAHLHSPTLPSAAATELAIGLTNQSMDTFDQAPAATMVEDHLTRWLARQLGLPRQGGGVMTAGGTASNLLGLLLARDRGGTHIVASETAHFSVQRAAHVLGLGREAVVPVATDERGRMDVRALDTTLTHLDQQGHRVCALVGTAGTTDAGAIDPLAELADRARARRIWFHVDAAVGGAFCLSERLRPWLDGIELADSIVVDMHKLWWQPIGASALLVRDLDDLEVVRQPSDYLDRREDDDLGTVNLVARSLDTSRRFDALKVLVSLRHLGRRRMADMLEHLVDTTATVAQAIEAHPDLELLADPATVMVLFRWRGAGVNDEIELDVANTAIQRNLFASGRAVVGRTRHRGRVALKLTLVNPQATASDIAGLLDLVATEGRCWNAATASHAEALLNCYLRESSRDERVDGVTAKIRYSSHTFRHRFNAAPLDLHRMAAVLFEQLSAGNDRPADPATLLARIDDSVRNTTHFLHQRAGEVDRLWSAEPLQFIESEQALLLGHPLHPTPKSRGEMSPAERERFSPETRGEFKLHWLAALPEIVRHRSALERQAPTLVDDLLRDDPATDIEALDHALASLGERVLLPAHPWELAYLRERPEVAGLFERGELVDLGPLGSPVTPTTSVRTIYGPHWPWQMKFSLHVRVTNSMRVSLPKELERAVEAALLSYTDVGKAASRLAPAFVLLQDPAYLTIVGDEGQVIDGFSVLLRQNRWPLHKPNTPTNVTAVTTLCQDHPFDPINRTSRLGQIAQGRGREWFARFCDVVVVSLARLYLDLGLCFEAHQQNTLLELDHNGMPLRAVYRDSQGYFHREAAHEDMCKVIPHLGEASESIFPEDLADERLVYYPFLNLTLGVINALGAAGCADEAVLLADLRECLARQRKEGGRYPSTLLDRLLDDNQWPCKANLRTRFHDLDELMGEIETQSVYVTVPNPL